MNYQKTFFFIIRFHLCFCKVAAKFAAIKA